jgi:hypothetical protein
MFGNLLTEKPGFTGRSAHDRDQQPKAVHNHFQVNFKFRRYWSGNTVFDGEKPINELRFCPECMDVIEHDERGYPHCLSCGSIFPLPQEPRAKMKKQRAYEMRRFIRLVRVDGIGRDPGRAKTEHEATPIKWTRKSTKHHQYVRDPAP